MGHKQTFCYVDISLAIYRSSSLQVFHKIDILENFAKFTGQCLIPFLIKLEVSSLQRY